MKHYDRNIKYCFFSLFFLFSAAAICRLPAQEANGNTDKLLELPVPLIVNGKPAVSVTAYIDEQTGELRYLSSADMRSFLSEYTNVNIGDIKKAWPDSDLLSPDTLESAGIPVFFDIGNLILSLNVPWELLKPAQIEFSKRSGPDGTEVLRPEPFSGWLNIFTAQNLNARSTLDYSPEYLANFTFELGLNVCNFVTESKLSFNTNPNSQILMPDISIIYDLEKSKLRFTGGHFQLVPKFYQTGGTYQGISISYNPSFDPAYRAYRNDDLHFTLEKESEVEFRLNGRKLRSYRLSPGHYSLADFPVYSGLNTVEIHIIDENGRHRILENSVPYDSGLISGGQQKFSYAAGIAPWEIPSDFIFSGYHALGLSNYVNLGLQFQTTLHHFTGGTSLLWATPVGSFNIAAAASVREREEFGWSAEFTYRLAENSSQYLPVLSLSSGFASEDFRTVNQDESMRFFVTGNISQKLSKRLSARIKYYYYDYRENNADSSGIDASMNINVSELLYLGINARTSLSELSLESSSLTFTLQLRDLEHNSSASHVQDLISGQPVQSVQKAFPKQNLDASVLLTGPDTRESGNYSGQGALRYSGNRLNGTVSSLYEKNGNNKLLSSSLYLSTGIVFAGPVFALTNPVSDSFLIVVPKYDLEGKAVGINGNGLKYENRSDHLGPLVVSNLPSYRYKQIHVDLLDKFTDPLLFLRKNDFVVFPTYRSGSVLDIGNRPSVDLSIMISDESGSPITFKGGKLHQLSDTEQNNSKDILFFTDENGLAVVYSLREGRYRLSIPGYTAEEIEIEMVEGETSAPQEIPLTLKKGEQI